MNMGKTVKGLLVIGYGTRPGEETDPDNKPEGIERFIETTEKQAESLRNQLNELQDGTDYQVYVGFPSASPTIEQAVEKMAQDGIDEAVSIVFTPHYSTLTVKRFQGRAKAKAGESGIEISVINSWHEAPGYIWYWANAIKDIYDGMTFEEQEKTVVLFSAQSLPDKIVDVGDPYPHQVEESAQLISDASGVFHFDIGWQSEGNGSEPWLGPDIEDLTRILYHEMDYRSFIFAPIGYVTDQPDVLHDIDVRCKAVCQELEARFYRPELPNTDLLFIDGLANVVLKHQ